MKYYKSQDNQIYALEDDAPESFLPKACEPVPEATALAIANPPPKKEKMIQQYIGEVRARLDTFAQTRGYASALDACSFASSTVDRFAADGKRCFSLRDATWVKFYELIAADKLPSLEELISKLPPLTWTN